MPDFKSFKSVSHGHYSCKLIGAARSVIRFSIPVRWAGITVGVAQMQASPQAI